MKMIRFLLWELCRLLCLWAGFLLIGIVYTAWLRGVPGWVEQTLIWVTNPLAMLLSWLVSG